MSDTIRFWDDEKGEPAEVSNTKPLPVRIEGGGGGSGPVDTDGIKDGAVTTQKLAQEVISRIDMGKISFIEGQNHDANKILDPGVYIHIGGYGLKNAPRDDYGWILIVSRGSSNDHKRGAQVYFDYQGFDWRGYDGEDSITFTEWHTCIVKNAVESIAPIADPSKATTQDIAERLNALISAMKQPTVQQG